MGCLHKAPTLRVSSATPLARHPSLFPTSSATFILLPIHSIEPALHEVLICKGQASLLTPSSIPRMQELPDWLKLMVHLAQCFVSGHGQHQLLQRRGGVLPQQAAMVATLEGQLLFVGSVKS